MAVTTYTHDEPLSKNGKPVFKIQTPNPYFTGKRKGVPFFDGLGRTESPRRAKYLAEVLHYDVTLPSGYAGAFEFAVLTPPTHEDDLETWLVDEDPEDDDTEDDY